MDDKNIKGGKPFVEQTQEGTSFAEEPSVQEMDAQEAVEWGETHQERILDKSAKRKSARHVCKGPSCVKAFEKS